MTAYLATNKTAKQRTQQRQTRNPTALLLRDLDERGGGGEVEHRWGRCLEGGEGRRAVALAQAHGERTEGDAQHGKGLKK